MVLRPLVGAPVSACSWQKGQPAPREGAGCGSKESRSGSGLGGNRPAGAALPQSMSGLKWIATFPMSDSSIVNEAISDVWLL